MTKLGWPVAQPRLTSRPLASTMMRLPFGPDHVIDLRLDLLPFQIAARAGDLDFAVEMADVADDGVVLHLVHVLRG